MLTNYGDILERVRYELRGLPNVRAARKNAEAVVSEVHRDICEAYEWPWLRQFRPVLLMPDIVIPNGSIIRVSDRTWTTTVAALATAMGLTTGVGTGSIAAYAAMLQGATFDLYDRTLLDEGDGNWSMGPFEVWAALTDSTTVTLLCDPRMEIDSKTGDEGDFVIRFPRMLLTSDIEQVLGVRLKSDRSPLVAIRPDSARELEEDRQGVPSCFWLDDGFRPRFAPGGVTATAHVPIAPVRNMIGAFGLQVAPPVGGSAPTKFSPGGFSAAATNSSGTLLAGTYRIFCTWLVAGRLSPPSEQVEVTVASPNDTIEITGSPEAATADSGKRLLWWFSFNDGPFFLDQNTSTTSTLALPMSDVPFGGGTKVITTNVDRTRDYAAIRWDEAYNGPSHRYLSVWPRPAEVREAEVEVVVRGRELIDPTDVPLLPQPFLDCIVWEAARRIAAVQNADAGTMDRCKEMADTRMDALRRRYGAHDAVRIQRDVHGVDDHRRVMWPDIINHRPD